MPGVGCPGCACGDACIWLWLAPGGGIGDDALGGWPGGGDGPGDGSVPALFGLVTGYGGPVGGLSSPVTLARNQHTMKAAQQIRAAKIMRISQAVMSFS